MENFIKKVKEKSTTSMHDINNLTVYRFSLVEFLERLPLVHENKRKKITKEIIEIDEFINENIIKNEDNIGDGSTN